MNLLRTLLLVSLATAASALDSIPQGIFAIPSQEEGDFALGGAAVLIAPDTVISLVEATGAVSDDDPVTLVGPGGRRYQGVVTHVGEQTGAIQMSLAGADIPAPLALATTQDLQVGTVVWTVGNPFNALQNDGRAAASRGIISGLYPVTAGPPVRGRGGKVLSRYRGPIIETTAAVNDGNQGGALVDDAGNLVALVSLGFARDRRMGTAIPLDLIMADLGLEMPTQPSSGAFAPEVEPLMSAAAQAAASTVLVYLRRPMGPANPQAVSRPNPITDETPPYLHEDRQKEWDLYYHQQQLFFTDQAIPAVVIDAEKGLMLTSANHLHGGPGEGTLVDGGGNVSIEVMDEAVDLAILKHDGPLSIPSLSSTAALPAVGSAMALVGRHREGGAFTITQGVVSANGRILPHCPAPLIQTDALANYANLGGPAVTGDGTVGIVVQLNPVMQWGLNSGVAFVLPIDTALTLAQRLLDSGPTAGPPRLGVELDPTLTITGLEPDGAAATAGMEVGDVLKLFNNQPINTLVDLRRQLTVHRPGDTVSVGFERLGEMRTLELILGGGQ